MRFTEAWADVASKNTALKYVVFVLALCCVTFAVTTTRLALKEPLVIERACVSKAVTTGSPDRTTTEVESFVREAISRRFNSDGLPSEGYLSLEEDAGRKKEQQTLQTQGMRQRVIVNSTKIDGNQITLDCYRIISVGAVLSALPFPLTATIGTMSRTEANPYGLVLVNVSNPDAGKKGRK
jgi:hypothetical protein